MDSIKIIDILNEDKVGISCELFPPKVGSELGNALNIVDEIYKNINEVIPVFPLKATVSSDILINSIDSLINNESKLNEIKNNLNELKVEDSAYKIYSVIKELINDRRN